MTTRYMTEASTRGEAPSHSPPDVHYAPGRGLAQALGWFSIGLGLAELLAPRTMARLTGVHQTTLLQAFGVRELAAGIGILSCARPTEWMWGRVGGDVLDLGTLAAALSHADSDERERTLAALGAVAGVTLLDVLCSLQLSAAAAVEG